MKCENKEKLGEITLKIDINEVFFTKLSGITY